MFKIGDFSRLSGVSIRMLRHYDKLGLLLPKHIDECSSYRYYTAEQLSVVGKIGQLRELGFSLTLIKEMLQGDMNQDDLHRFLRLKQMELQEELKVIEKQVTHISSLLQQGADIHPYHVILKEIPQRHVLSVRRVIATYHHEAQLWNTLYASIAQQKIQLAPDPCPMAIFHDLEHKTDNIDVEVQVSIEGNINFDLEKSANLLHYTTEPIEIASVMINGSYEQMGAVSQVVAQWIEEHGYDLNGPMFNIYHVSPAQETNPEKWVTEACFPVKLLK